MFFVDTLPNLSHRLGTAAPRNLTNFPLVLGLLLDTRLLNSRDRARHSIFVEARRKSSRRKAETASRRDQTV